MRNCYVGSNFARQRPIHCNTSALIDQATQLSYKPLLKFFDACLPYIQTNLALSDIISYDTKVLTFYLENIEQLQVPNHGYDNVNHSVTYKGFSSLYGKRVI